MFETQWPMFWKYKNQFKVYKNIAVPFSLLSLCSAKCMQRVMMEVKKVRIDTFLKCTQTTSLVCQSRGVTSLQLQKRQWKIESFIQFQVSFQRRPRRQVEGAIGTASIWVSTLEYLLWIQNVSKLGMTQLLITDHSKYVLYNNELHNWQRWEGTMTDVINKILQVN